jgi:hypothetical protein
MRTAETFTCSFAADDAEADDVELGGVDDALLSIVPVISTLWPT